MHEGLQELHGHWNVKAYYLLCKGKPLPGLRTRNLCFRLVPILQGAAFKLHHLHSQCKQRQTTSTETLRTYLRISKLKWGNHFPLDQRNDNSRWTCLLSFWLTFDYRFGFICNNPKLGFVFYLHTYISQKPTLMCIPHKDTLM